MPSDLDWPIWRRFPSCRLIFVCCLLQLLAAVAGFSVGFLIFGSQDFRNNFKIEPYQDLSDLPPPNC